MTNLILTFYVIATSSALVVLKLGTGGNGAFTYVNNKLSLNFNWVTLAGIALFGVSFILYVYLISKFQLGYIVPVTTALVYILVFTASFVIFKETFTLAKVTGIALILIGVFLLNQGK